MIDTIRSHAKVIQPMDLPSIASPPSRRPPLLLVAGVALLAAGCPADKDDGERPGGMTPSSMHERAAAPHGVTEGAGAGDRGAAASIGSWTVVTEGPLAERVPAVGTLRARQATRVGSEVSGEVKEVLVDVGDRVAAGQELVRLEPTFFQIERDQREQAVEAAGARLVSVERGVETARADVSHAEAALAEADVQLGRMRNLWEKPEGQAPSIPKSRFDEADFRQRAATARLRAARSRVAEAEAARAEAAVAVRQAEQALRHARERLDKTLIRSPYAGVVTQRLVDVGEPVTATPVTHLVEVQEVAVLYLEFALPQELMGQVGPETPITFAVEGSGKAERPGRIATVFPSLDAATRSFRCRVVVDNAGHSFTPGSLARVSVTVRSIPEALVVPRSALVRTSKGWTVTVERDGRVVRQVVELGLITEADAQVVEGLRPGDRVLVRASS
ncbi:MAG: efflux RND transporter periplasmic adaptor subunit [Planctomycetes bacterium]|nr:efflux RND transporter periplasmic adaptor subunit [Planctomycetota bacterium]